MLRRRPRLAAAFVFALASATWGAPARADEPETPDATEDADAPDAEEATPVAPRTDPGVLRAFRDRRLTYDPSSGGAYEGQGAQRLDARELYARMGRQDLVARVDAQDKKKSLLLWTGGGAIIVGLAGLVVAYATAPDINNAHCSSDIRTYNEECVPAYRAHQTAGLVSIGVGGLLGMTLLFMGLGERHSPVPHDEAQALVRQHNGALLRGLRGPGAERPAEPESRAPRLRLAPQVGPTGASVSALLTF